MDENIKEIIKEMLCIMKEELASAHIYTDCDGDYNDDCEKNLCSCACKCRHSKELYDKLSSLEQKLEKS